MCIRDRCRRLLDKGGNEMDFVIGLGKLLLGVFVSSICAMVVGGVAVSYTHLDVYKRQAQRGIG